MNAKSDSFRLKRIYEAPDAEDGRRILVDRMWPRGMKKEDAQLSLWMKQAAPSPKLCSWFGHVPERFEEFQTMYADELRGEDRRPYLEQLKAWLEEGPVTLLYAAKDPVHNHAVVLKEYLDRMNGAFAPQLPLF